MPGASASVGIAGGFIPGGLTNGGVGGGAPTGKYNLLQNGGATGVLNDNAAALSALSATIPATGGTIYVPSGLYRIRSNTAIASAVTLELAPGAQLSIDAGVTLTINGTLVAPLAQVFFGAGNVVLGRGHILQILPQWWGATGDGVHDDTDAIQKAATACIGAGGGEVFFAPGTYSIVGTIVVNGRLGANDNSIFFRGAGVFVSRLVKPAGGAGDVLVWNCVTVPNGVSDLGIVAGIGGAFACSGLTTTTGCNGTFIERCWFAALQFGCFMRGSDIFISHCVAELNTVGFHLEGNIQAHALDAYQNGTGYDVSYGVAPAYPEPPISLMGCRDTEATTLGMLIHDTNNAVIVGWMQQSSLQKPVTSVQVQNTNAVQFRGGSISGSQNGIESVGSNSDLAISDMTLLNLGSAAGGGHGIVLSSASTRTRMRGLTINTTYKSAIVTGSSVSTVISDSTIALYGRGLVAGDQFGIALSGDAAFKGTRVDKVHFAVNPADPQTAIWFDPGAHVGVFAVRRCTRDNATLFDLTNAPAGALIESNEGENWAAAVPAAGYHLAGEIVTNTAPAEQGVAGSKYVVTGWICTATGTPGTWLPMRALTGN